MVILLKRPRTSIMRVASEGSAVVSSCRLARVKKMFSNVRSLNRLPALAAVFALLCGSASAANHYVRAGAGGNGSGADWTNACPDFSNACAVASLVRGDTYYIAAGKYTAAASGQFFNTPVSGTALITLKRATVADHGTDTGWNSTFDGQAHFAYPRAFFSGYWLVDGQTGSMQQGAGFYGIQVDQPASCSTVQDNYMFIGNPNGIAVSNVTIQ